MSRPTDTTTRPYEPPRLRPLGSVHELTQGVKQLGDGDAVLWHGEGVVNSS